MEISDFLSIYGNFWVFWVLLGFSGFLDIPSSFWVFLVLSGYLWIFLIFLALPQKQGKGAQQKYECAIKIKRVKTNCFGPYIFGRDERIRTSGLSVPNAALHQTEPHPVALL